MGIEAAMARFIDAATTTSSQGSRGQDAVATAATRATSGGSRGSPGSRDHGNTESLPQRNAAETIKKQATVRAAVRFRLIDGQGAGTQIADDYQDAVDALRMRYGNRLECMALEGSIDRATDR